MPTRDFTIIFEHMDVNAALTDTGPEDQIVPVMLAESYSVELDELAELRRLVSEISDPEPLYFTTS